MRNQHEFDLFLVSETIISIPPAGTRTPVLWTQSVCTVSLPVRALWVFAQHAQQSFICALENVIRHAIVQERIEAL